MASAAQIAANRKNARASTGPRTVDGKARASRNATRHGLNGRPPHEAVLEAYRCIVGDPSARPSPLEMEMSPSAAWRLAEAEARLSEVRAKEAVFLRKLDSGEDLSELLLHTRTVHIKRRSRIPGVDPEVERMLPGRRGRVPYEEVRIVHERFEELSARLRKLLRYRREAEVARTRALRDWIAEQKAA